MVPFVRFSKTGEVPSLIETHVLSPSWLVSIRQRDILDTQSASDVKLIVSGIFIVHPRNGESRSGVTFGVVTKASVSALLEMTIIDRYIR